jgi:hypothetical protein
VPSMSDDKMVKVFGITKKIDAILSGTFKVENKDLVLKSLESTLQYSLITTLKNEKNNKLRFEKMNIRRLIVTSSPGFTFEKEAVTKTENGFLLDPSKLSKSATDFSLMFEVETEIEKIVKDLVNSDHQIEAVGEETNSYWLSSQIRYLALLESTLRKVELLDIPFIVNVAVHQDIKTKFPSRRQRELELIAEWARSADRNKAQLLTHEHLTLKSQKPKEKDITQILNDLQFLFMPPKFKSYVDVLNDFYYSDCFQGADFYDTIPFRTFPKWMSVVSRTDLSLDEPASEGRLVYKKAELQDAVEKAIKKK